MSHRSEGEGTSLHGLAKMNKVLFVFVFALTAVECSENLDVSFSGLNFTMTCGNADGDAITWKHKDEPPKQGANILSLKYDDKTMGKYTCTTASKKLHYFYVKGKVCENCYELSGTLLMGLIFMDLLVTGGLIILIYNCAQRKSASAPSSAPASRRPARGSGPSVPDRDYEPLNLATRDTSTYAVAGVHRTG